MSTGATVRSGFVPFEAQQRTVHVHPGQIVYIWDAPHTDTHAQLALIEIRQIVPGPAPQFG